MKSFITILLLAALSCASYAQTPILLNKKAIKALPGVTAMANDYLFIDKAEISNLDWKEYMAWLAFYDTAQRRIMQPNTSVWKSDKIAYGQPFADLYYQHPAYNDYPLVGVSYKQAVAYCKWRTARVMESKAFKKTDIAEIIYRLPTEEEWRQAAWGTLPEGSPWPWEGESVKWENNKKLNGLAKLNHSLASWNQGSAENMNTQQNITTPVYSYWPNTFGIYNIVGNVSEWTSNQTALGGSWNDFAPGCQITTQHRPLKDTFTSNTIGFRCVLEVISFKDKSNILPSIITAKSIEKQFMYIPDTGSRLLFANSTETSNSDFLAFIKANPKQENQINHTNWQKYSPYAFHSLYGIHKAYSNYPVVNISHQAAENYCKWLTNIYNSSVKRKYRKVVFRLPTEAEWMEAARGGNNLAKFPHQGETPRNSKGCFLYNYSPNETKNNSNTTFAQKEKNRNIDGATYAAYCKAYFPNNYGLYNCAGNVAEMISETGKTKGGSWLSVEEEIYLTAPAQSFSSPEPTIGFRVFMEVLEK